ncbi:hypothetical protein D3C81_929720 [compost metagenome]
MWERACPRKGQHRQSRNLRGFNNNHRRHLTHLGKPTLTAYSLIVTPFIETGRQGNPAAAWRPPRGVAHCPEWSILMVGSPPLTSELTVVFDQFTPSSLIDTSALLVSPPGVNLPWVLTCKVDSPSTVVIFR